MENPTTGQKGSPANSNRKTDKTRVRADRPISHHPVTRRWERGKKSSTSIYVSLSMYKTQSREPVLYLIKFERPACCAKPHVLELFTSRWRRTRFVSNCIFTLFRTGLSQYDPDTGTLSTAFDKEQGALFYSELTLSSPKPELALTTRAHEKNVWRGFGGK